MLPLIRERRRDEGIERQTKQRLPSRGACSVLGDAHRDPDPRQQELCQPGHRCRHCPGLCHEKPAAERERETIVPPRWKFSRRFKIGSQLFNLFLILIMRGRDHGDHGKVKTSLCFSLSAQRRSCCCETPVCLKKHAVQLGKSAISIKGFFFVCSFSQEKAPYLFFTFLFRCSENM